MLRRGFLLTAAGFLLTFAAQTSTSQQVFDAADRIAQNAIGIVKL